MATSTDVPRTPYSTNNSSNNNNNNNNLSEHYPVVPQRFIRVLFGSKYKLVLIYLISCQQFDF